MTPQEIHDEEIRLYSLCQKRIKEAMGTLQWPDRYICLTYGDIDYHIADGDPRSCASIGHEIICLPLPIDPRNPERGLTGMIKGFRSIDGPDPEWMNPRWLLWSVQVHKGTDVISYDGESPTIALLKALASQEGEEE